MQHQRRNFAVKPTPEVFNAHVAVELETAYFKKSLS